MPEYTFPGKGFELCSDCIERILRAAVGECVELCEKCKQAKAKKASE